MYTLYYAVKQCAPMPYTRHTLVLLRCSDGGMVSATVLTAAMAGDSTAKFVVVIPCCRRFKMVVLWCALGNLTVEDFCSRERIMKM